VSPKKEKLSPNTHGEINVTVQQVNVFKKIFHLSLSLVIAIYFKLLSLPIEAKAENKFADIGERKTSVKTLPTPQRSWERSSSKMNYYYQRKTSTVENI
jgi:hypothetical protein